MTIETNEVQNSDILINAAEYLVGLTLYAPDAKVVPAAMSHVVVTLALANSMQQCIAELASTVAQLRAQLAAAEQHATYESDVAAQAVAAKEAAERERDYYEKQVKAGVVSYRPTDGETRAAYGRICALETERELLRTRAERAERVVEAADALLSYQGTDVEPQAWDTLNSVIGAYRTGGPV